MRAELDRDDLLERIVELEKLLALTTGLGRQFEYQRNSMVSAAGSSLGLLKLAVSDAVPLEDRVGCLLAIGKWLSETAMNVLPPTPWVGAEPISKHWGPA